MLGSHALAGPLHSIQVESQLLDVLASLPAQVLSTLLGHLSENSDRVDPRASPSASLCRVKMYFIWNSQHMGWVVVPLRLLASTVNVVHDILYFPVRLKFSDKRRSKLYILSGKAS